MRWAEIRKRIEEAMSAVAFAEEGEFEIARQIVKNRKTANKRVLLGTDTPEMDQKFVQYALQLCTRLGAGLEIIHVVDLNIGADRQNRELSQLQRSLENKNIVYQAVAGNGSFEEEVEKYTKGRRDILCVVLESAKKELRERRGVSGRKENKFFKNLSCPVVLFESQAKA